MNVDGRFTEGSRTQCCCPLPLLWEVEGLNPVKNDVVSNSYKIYFKLLKKMRPVQAQNRLLAVSNRQNTPRVGDLAEALSIYLKIINTNPYIRAKSTYIK